MLVASNLGKIGQNVADVNGDRIVNIQDLVLVAGGLGNSAAAPSLSSAIFGAAYLLRRASMVISSASLKSDRRNSGKGEFLFLEQLFDVVDT